MKHKFSILLGFAGAGLGYGVFYLLLKSTSHTVVLYSVLAAISSSLIWLVLPKTQNTISSKVIYILASIISGCIFGNMMWWRGYSIFTMSVVLNSDTDQGAMTVGCIIGALVWSLFSVSKKTHNKSRNSDDVNATGS